MRLAGYELSCEIGRGAQGVVYRAMNCEGREVALKSFHAPLRVEREHRPKLDELGQRARQLNHPAICAVHAVGEEEGRPFVVMDLLVGATLDWHLMQVRKGEYAQSELMDVNQDARLPLDLQRRTRRALKLVEGLARALHVAHDQGLVHGDLKPSNVMLAEGGQPVLLDLGWAHVGLAGGRRAVTPAYAAPEQLDGQRRCDARSDVHGLGLLLYELTTLEHPFRMQTRHGTIDWVLRHDVRLSRRWCRALPVGFAAVVETALEKQPHQRYPSALCLADDLRRVLDGEPVQARRAGFARQLGRCAVRNPRACTALAALTLALMVVFGAGLLEARTLHRAHVALERASDAALIPELLQFEIDGDWRVQPNDLPQLSSWLAQAQGVIARTSSISGAPPHPLSAAIARMRRRIADAETLKERTLDHHRELWDQTLVELRDPARSSRYSGLSLVALAGLVPLGRDPDSDLYEFVHVQSGTRPDRDPDSGRLLLGPDSGIVLVLIPSGEFEMGTNPVTGSAAAGGDAVDSFAQRFEAPRHTVPLEPFFIAKHELTLGQWRRLGGQDPRGTHPEKFPDEGDCHPARRLSWQQAARRLMRYGLSLPTEAQWEYAARAGTRTPWSWGADPARHIDYANLRDGGHAGTVPVGSFLPNAFGLFDVHGNVMELVRDAYGPYTLPLRPSDGERLGGNPDLRIGRGGAWGHVPSQARSAARYEVAPEFRSYQGCRPARGLRP